MASTLGYRLTAGKRLFRAVGNPGRILLDNREFEKSQRDREREHERQQKHK